MKMLIPNIYSIEISLLERIKLEILKNHKYFKIFNKINSEKERKEQIINSFHIITTETLFLFCIAMCYDIDVN
jgi:hypothetical protein